MQLTLFALTFLFSATFAARIAPGLYKITCVASGNVFDIEDASASDDANLITYQWHNGNNQQFLVSYADKNWAILIAQNSGKALTAQSNLKGAGFTQQTNTGSFYQQFKFLPAKNGSYLIKNRASGFVMKCLGPARTAMNNMVVFQYKRTCQISERFTFTRLD